MHNQYIVHKISLQHLKEESCEQLLKNAGWVKNHFNIKNGGLLDQFLPYNMPHAFFHLGVIFITICYYQIYDITIGFIIIIHICNI